MVGKIMVPFCVLNNIRHLIFRVPKKRGHNFDNYLLEPLRASFGGAGVHMAWGGTRDWMRYFAGDLGFRVWGLGLGLGFRVWGLGVLSGRVLDMVLLSCLQLQHQLPPEYQDSHDPPK